VDWQNAAGSVTVVVDCDVHDVDWWQLLRVVSVLQFGDVYILPDQIQVRESVTGWHTSWV